MQHSNPQYPLPNSQSQTTILHRSLLCLFIAMMCLSTPSWADGPIFSRGGGLAAPGPSPGYSISDDGSARFRSIDGGTLRGDVSAATVGALANTSTGVSRTLAARAADFQSAGDFGAIGGGSATYILLAQNAGDATATLPGTATVVIGRLLTAATLPVGTTILSAAAPVRMSPSYPTSAPTAVRSSSGMGTGLSFSTIFAVPPGASIAGAGIDATATVVRSVTGPSGTTVYMSLPVQTAVGAGTMVTFGFTSVKIMLSSAWLQAVQPATPVGLPREDDAIALQNATFFANSTRGGSGLLYVPSGNYYTSLASGGSDGVSVETAANVVLLPGSQPFGNLRGLSASTAAKTFASAAQNNLPSGVNIGQTIFQQTTPTDQAQVLLLNQHNINCIDDGGPVGCGMVGAEIQQDIEAPITAGIMWGYHVTDYIYPGQGAVSWVGAEFEVNDNSGTDKPRPGGTVVTYGTHLDLLGTTNGTAGIYFGASGAGRWHYGMACPQNAISDDCWSVHSGPASTVIAGVDMNGNLMAQTIRAAGSIVSTHAGSYMTGPADCGTTIRDTGASAHTYTVATGMPLGCRIDVVQAASGQVLFSGSAGVMVEAFGGATGTAGQYARAVILVDSATSVLLGGQIR
ncbi:hypothetical protein HN018_14935 [Lichenicola cladoniae]|uniref:Uncharacterized protein n=1 Tax=Lichenicola cladoniae TaxID=1484109 RepID=A0A6M8HSH4_9PROT|nr:hypothetical protein [Lichenicola cladoniae]QKE91167.1 hypothetical protein HN018_14935 [Lichenicola cladoniae]